MSTIIIIIIIIPINVKRSRQVVSSNDVFGAVVDIHSGALGRVEPSRRFTSASPLTSDITEPSPVDFRAFTIRARLKNLGTRPYCTPVDAGAKLLL